MIIWQISCFFFTHSFYIKTILNTHQKDYKSTWKLPKGAVPYKNYCNLYRHNKENLETIWIRFYIGFKPQILIAIVRLQNRDHTEALTSSSACPGYFRNLLVTLLLEKTKDVLIIDHWRKLYKFISLLQIIVFL